MMMRRGLWAALAAVGILTVSAIAKQPAEPELARIQPTARLITQAQYVNTLQSIFGAGLNYPSKFAPIARVDGLVAVGAGNAVITEGAFRQYEAAARLVADQVVDPRNRAFLMPCKPSSATQSDDACAKKFLSHVGSLLFRRPLKQDELNAYVTQAHATADNLKNFYSGISIVLAGMLQEPEFLYLTQPTVVVKGKSQLSAFAKASRLSLLLWDAYPDEELLAAAASGKLDTQKGLEQQVDRLLSNSERLGAGVRSFFEDMLVFENFETLVKDGTIYPAFTPKVTEDAKEQVMRTIVAHVVDEDADYRDLFTTRKTFLTNDLSAIYGVSVNRPDRWVPYEFPADSPRAGLLSEIGFLAVYAHPGRSSPTRRGKAIREVLLCQKVPNPPPNVDFSSLENPDPSLKTARERLSAHSKNPVCAGCHKITDPMGLALENFDGAGNYRANENGAHIDTSGGLDNVQFTDFRGLAAAIRDNPRTVSCLTERMSSYALSRSLKNEDRNWVAYVQDKFAASGYRVKGLLRAIAVSEKFYAVPTELSTGEGETTAGRS